MFRLNVTSKFIPKINAKANANANIRDNYINKEKQVEVVKIPPSILSRPSKETLEKSKFYKKKYIKLKKNGNSKDRCLYVQALTPTVNEILKLKKNFVMLSMKDLVFKKQLVRKLVDQYVGPYIIDEVVSMWSNYNYQLQ